MKAKRFLGILLSLALLLSLMSGMRLTAYADDSSLPSGNNNENQDITTYHLRVGTTPVMDLTNNVNGNGWSYTPASGNNPATLTLKNATITDGYWRNSTDPNGKSGIYYDGPDPLNIVLQSDTINTVNSVSYGIYFNSAADLTISGEGSFTANGSLYGIFSIGNVIIENGTVDVFGELIGIGVDKEAGVTITGGTVIASGKDRAISSPVKRSISGIGWANYDGTGDKTDIPISSDSGQELLHKKVQFPAEKAKITTKPTAKNLTENGFEQELVNAGTATGGTMQYALGTKDAATEPYTTSIPKGTEAKTYYVWYKAAGDETHTDSAADCISVTIRNQENQNQNNQNQNNQNQNNQNQNNQNQNNQNQNNQNQNNQNQNNQNQQNQNQQNQNQQNQNRQNQNNQNQNQQNQNKQNQNKQNQNNGRNNSGAGSQTGTKTEQITIAKRPASVKAKVKKKSKSKIRVSWKKIKKNKSGKKLLKKIKSIQIQISTDPQFKQIVKDKKVGMKKTKVTLKLKRKTKYYVRVRYIGKNGVSKWSKVKKVKTK